MPDNKFTRFRFSVPKADRAVHEWAEAQANLSISLRALIRENIRQYGITDATCMPVQPGCAAARQADGRQAVAKPEPAPRTEPEAKAPAPEPLPVPEPPAQAIQVQQETPTQAPARPEPQPKPAIVKSEPIQQVPGAEPMDDSQLEDMLGIH